LYNRKLFKKFKGNFVSLIFLILQFVLAVVITIAVLLQKSSSIGLGAYSDSVDSKSLVIPKSNDVPAAPSAPQNPAK